MSKRSIGYLALSVVLGAFFGFADACLAQNCACPKVPEVEEAFAQSSAVFVGKIENQEESALRQNMLQVQVFVKNKFKWLDELAGKQLTVIYTAPENDPCGFKFQNGFDYLIFAKGNPAFLKVDVCSRTQVLENAQVDQQKLQRILNKK